MVARTLPPGPKGRVVTGNLLSYTADQLGYLTQCARGYGDIVRLRLLNVPAVLLNHPNHIEYVLVKNNRNFIKSRGERHALSHLGGGLLTSEGSFWRRQRRLVQPAFHRTRIEAYGEEMVRSTERTIDLWRDNQRRDVHQDMSRLTLEIVSRTLFGTLPSAEFEEIGDALAVIMRRFSGRGGIMFQIPERVPTPANRRFLKALRLLDRIIYKIIRDRQERGADTRDLLSVLLAVRDEETGEGMSDKQLRDEVATIFLAGHETTANALSWAFYLLGRNRAAEQELLTELREVLGGRAPTVADLPRLRYTDMVVKEAMRLYPPVWAFGREALEDCEIGGYHVPAGTQLLMSQWVTHRDPRYFATPETFYPGRWTEEMEHSLPKYAYFPFGGGPRLCIGQPFAKMEAALLLATIAQRFRLELEKEQQIIPQPSVTLRPRYGVKVMLAQR